MIESVGDDYRRWPRSLWGTRDRARAAREDRARAQVKGMARATPTEFEPLPSASRRTCRRSGSIRRDRGQAVTRSGPVDAVLEKLGIQPARGRSSSRPP